MLRYTAHSRKHNSEVLTSQHVPKRKYRACAPNINPSATFSQNHSSVQIFIKSVIGFTEEQVA